MSTPPTPAQPHDQPPQEHEQAPPGLRVCKFGGSSLAEAAMFRRVRAIVEAEPQRRYLVPSAPGKRSPEDRKVTDLLYLCYENAKQRLPFEEPFQLVRQRFQRIVAELGLSLDIDALLEGIRTDLNEGATSDYAASRGEFLSGQILAAYLGWPFVDAAEVIRFRDNGRLDNPATYRLIAQRLEPMPHAVVPGYYGRDSKGRIRTFSRGGSDVTGSLVAQGAAAAVYENWTDVSGLLMADPRIVDNPKGIRVITYKELRELAYMGATVLHDEAIFPVRDAGIPVNIRNTYEPEHPGTLIVAKAPPTTQRGVISGIAGRKDFTVVTLEKALMNNQVGFGRRVLQVFEENGISYEHTPSGIDTMSVVVADAAIEGKLEQVIEDLRSECHIDGVHDSIQVFPEMALIATVGRGMARTPGVSAKLFGALAGAEVNVRMIDQGSSELNIIVGVAVEDFEKAMRAIYEAFEG